MISKEKLEAEIKKHKLSAFELKQESENVAKLASMHEGAAQALEQLLGELQGE